MAAYPKNRSAARYRQLWAVGATLLLVAAVGAWTHHAAKEGTRNLLAAGLQSILSANINAIVIWIENEKATVAIWAADVEVRNTLQELARFSDQEHSPEKSLPFHPQQAALKKALATAVADIEYRGFAAINRNGLILASDQVENYIGRQVSESMMPELQRVFAGGALFIRPMPKDILVKGGGVGDLPVILVAAPVADEQGKNIAALVFVIDPEQDFSRILSAGYAGKSGDSFAFDERGLLLSESRHEAQFTNLGLVSEAPEIRSVLRVPIRDPGGDLTQGYRVVDRFENLPLTRMAASAVTGQAGMDLEGYRDIRGVWVIGSWRWLTDYGFGVATEVSQVEAHQNLRPISLAFSGLLALLAVLALAIVLSSWVIQRLRHRIERLGQYTLVEKIGEGGMGTVFRARHSLLRRPTVIKLIKGDQTDTEAITRFEKEVQLTSELTHPNTVSVYDYGRTPEGVFYYAMEYLPGINLEQLVMLEGTVPPARVVHILRQACASLSEAHGRGLIHRDIKPQNIILCERGGIPDFVKVLDFGLVQETAQPDPAEVAGQGVFGSPGFIAPERLTHQERTDARADIYSLGAVAFFLLTGDIPFSGSSNAEICDQVVHSPPPRPSERCAVPIPSVLDELVFECLAKNPENRPHSAGEIVTRLASMDFCDEWTSAEAGRWWQENLQRIRSLGLAKRSSDLINDRTLSIDWGRRHDQ